MMFTQMTFHTQHHPRQLQSPALGWLQDNDTGNSVFRTPEGEVHSRKFRDTGCTDSRSDGTPAQIVQ